MKPQKFSITDILTRSPRRHSRSPDVCHADINGEFTFILLNHTHFLLRYNFPMLYYNVSFYNINVMFIIYIILRFVNCQI